MYISLQVHRVLATVLSILHLSMEIPFELTKVLIAFREIYLILPKGDAKLTGTQELCSALLQQNRVITQPESSPVRNVITMLLKSLIFKCEISTSSTIRTPVAARQLCLE